MASKNLDIQKSIRTRHIRHMLLQCSPCHKLRVFFVSRHMSLVDACHYATKDVILEDVINIDKELRKSRNRKSTDRCSWSEPT